MLLSRIYIAVLELLLKSKIWYDAFCGDAQSSFYNSETILSNKSRLQFALIPSLSMLLLVCCLLCCCCCCCCCCDIRLLLMWCRRVVVVGHVVMYCNFENTRISKMYAFTRTRLGKTCICLIQTRLLSNANMFQSAILPIGDQKYTRFA